MFSSELFELMQRKGYPEPFARLICRQMSTEYTSERMMRYISRSPLLSAEEVADEVLAILSDRDRLVKKHISEHTQKKLNEWYRENKE